MKSDDSFCLLKRQTGGIGDSLFSCTAASQFNRPAHPDFTTHIICKPDNIPTQCIESRSAFIHCYDYTVTGVSDFLATLRLQLQKLVMLLESLFETR